jgi:isocitrate dehydrogenase
MASKIPITVAHGDGIGPEIMSAVLAILKGAGAELDIDTIEIGEAVYLRGNTIGIEEKSWESLRRTRVFLKAPITTPQGGGFKSLNVAVRKGLGLFANVRPCVSYHPYIDTKHPKMDVVIVRENEEDLYAGIEYRQTDEMMEGLKLISRPGCEKIIRYAFEYAVINNRKKVTCFMKDNIMKMTDGLFHRVFDEIAKEYPHITAENWIVDIGAAKLADTPEAFDVVVMQNLYGDILSDVAAQIAGSVGLAGSANIGDQCAMFEAIHGSAPRRAGQNLANPSGLLHGAILMLVHIGQGQIAERVHNAWLKTIEDGVHTYDIFTEGVSKEKVGTKEFGQAVVARLGKTPERLKAVSYNADLGVPKIRVTTTVPSKKVLVGSDVFVHARSTPEEMVSRMQKIAGDLQLTMIANRGSKVWPNGPPGVFCTDHWRARFEKSPEFTPVSHRELVELLGRLADSGADVIKTENLYTFDGQPGFNRTSAE